MKEISKERIENAARAIGEILGFHDDNYPFTELVTAVLKADDALRGDGWQPIETAPKDEELWILGIDAEGTQRVMRWCTEFPCIRGVWMFAYEPSDYIDGIQDLNPTHWQPLPALPKSESEV